MTIKQARRHDIDILRIYIRLAHKDGCAADDEARARLKQEIHDLIEADPDYSRIVTCGP